MYTPERKTIYIDVRYIHPTSEFKYIPTTSMNGFTLTIRNVSKTDLNVNYSCTYGFKESIQKMLLEEDVFAGKENSIIIMYDKSFLLIMQLMIFTSNVYGSSIRKKGRQNCNDNLKL